MTAPLPPSAYRWNAVLGRYVAPDGRMVSAAEVRAALDAAIEVTAAETRALTEQLRTGAITLAAWILAMRERIKSSQLYAAALARGGWAQMSPADYTRVSRAVRDQYAFLERFARQVAPMLQPARLGPIPAAMRAAVEAAVPLDGHALQRAELYAEAARATYHRTNQEKQQARGMTEERNVLHLADHCEGEGSCVEESFKAWQPVGTLIPIGERLCGPRCKCTLEYRKGAA